MTSDAAEPNSETPIWMKSSRTEEERSRFARPVNYDYQRALKTIVDEHTRWIHSNGREGTRLCICDQDLSGALFNGSRFEGTGFLRSSFKRAALLHCDFSNADLAGAKFENAYMPSADFTGADMTQAKFPKAKMTYRGLVESKIRGATVTKTSGSASHDR